MGFSATPEIWCRIGRVTTGATGTAEHGSIEGRLRAQHLLLTGVTGFVGEALLHLLLSEVPGCRVSVLVRPKGGSSGADRVATLLANPIFAGVVEPAGGVDAVLADRVDVLEGDLGDVPPLPAGLHAVAHCAGDVSFDPPVDEGFRTNVVGVRDLLARVDEAAARDGSDIAYVHVSTAYVAGRRRGWVPEAPVEHDVDLEAELAWGLSQRAAVETRSREADELARHRRKAEKEHSRAGLLAAANATEEARRQWVEDELVRIGAERARSLGWTDCYTFTKALGERVVEEWARQPAPAPGKRASIVRPSIIESALRRPHPGWIEGFKMADPLILAYGRGELPEVPAAADTAADLVPVDQVVAAVVAVLAHPPDPGEPAYFHVSSGDRNPLRFARLYELVRGYFEEHPFVAGDRGSIRLPEWRFPGAHSVERLLWTSERAHRAADAVLARAPRGDRVRDWSRRLDRQGKRLQFLRRYLDIYHEYTRADLRFSDDRTLALHRSLSPEDQERFAFDTAVVDWAVYLQEIHCPAVTQPIRDLDALHAARKRGAGGGRRTTTGPVGEAPGAAAFFDMDGTLLSSNVVETYLWMRLRELTGAERVAELGRMAGRVPALLAAERRERQELVRAVYREYRGARLADLEAVVDEHLTSHVLSRLAPAGVRRIREHRAAGQRTVLITGAIRPLTRPLAPLFDHVEAADLAVDEDGVCTGRLASPPLAGESRARWMRAWAREEGIDLAASFGYADSHSDLPLLEAVGNPVVVQPDVALHRHARRHRWTVVDWASPGSSTRSLDPARSGS